MLNMRKILYILIFLLTLSSVMSCGRSVDKRLVLADTLMWVNPDSSLAILNAINRDSLQGDENQAYHALLLTQAQFRCNGHCASDSLINTAINHYSDNHNREHYTRALLYKGAYYEFNTNQPVEAMRYYKMAEDNADTTDYRNLAQINLRMGKLYYDNFASNNLDLEKFEKALYYYSYLNDKSKIIFCHHHIGDIFRLTNQDSAIQHLDIAIKLAVETGDSAEYFNCLTSKSLSLLFDGQFNKAKECAIMSALNGSKYVDDNTFYNAARAYCALGMVDSAQLFLSKASANPDNKQILAMRYLTMTDIFSKTGDLASFKKYEELYCALRDSLSNNQNVTAIFDNENSFQNQSSNNTRIERDKSRRLVACLIVAIALAIIIVGYLFLRIHSKRKQEKIEFLDTLKTISEKHELEKSQLQQLFRSLEMKSKELGHEMSIKDSYSKILRDMVARHIVVMEKLASTYAKGSDSNFKSDFIKIVGEYREASSFWEAATAYVNDNYKGFFDRVDTLCPKLSDKQKKIITLHCLGFDYVNCAVILGTSASSMGVMCTRIADRLGTDLSLKKFVEKLKMECINES